MTSASLEHLELNANGVGLHAVAAGPLNGPLVLLLHGFPEFWYGWRYQLPALAAAGFRVVAPDQRGYNLSGKPKDIDAYSLDTLGRDVIGLLDALKRDKAHLVGHDLGAGVGWWVASNCPERIEKLAVLNYPHPDVMLENVHSNPRQILTSAYAYFFQIPRLPEIINRATSGRVLWAAMKISSRRRTFGREEFARYREAWAQPRAFEGMINWHRAAARRTSAPAASRRVRVPTLIVWGEGDRFLRREMASTSLSYCDAGQLVFVERATHWIQHEQAAQVNDLLIEFLHGHSPRRGSATAYAASKET